MDFNFFLFFSSLLSKTIFLCLLHLSIFFLVFNFWWCCRRVFDIPDILRVYIFYFFVPVSIFVTEFFIFSFKNFRNFFLPFFLWYLLKVFIFHSFSLYLFNFFLMFQILEFFFNSLNSFLFLSIKLFHPILSRIHCFILKFQKFHY